ncbi:MAG: hypothetical protein DRP83_01625, partial [Planctomycetota bacterium]
FKRAHVRGINHELVRQGLIGWPTEKIAEEAADMVADELPEEEMPEVSGEEGLSAEEAAGVIDKLVDVAEEIAEKTSHVVDEEFPKLAASVSYEDAASAHARSLVIKVASEAGTDVTGDGRFQEDMMEGGMGPIDAQKDPSSEKVGPQGTTGLDTSPGEVGAQEPQTPPPGASAPTSGEVAKLSFQLADVLKKLSSTDPGSGNTGAPGHAEPPDNQTMSGVAPAQGKTTQPKGPLMGEQKPQPRADSVATSGEVSKLSSLVKEVIEKMGGEMPEALKEKAEEKKEESKNKDEEKKEESSEDEKKAELVNALNTLSEFVSGQ